MFFFSWNEIIVNLLSNEARVVHLILFLLSDNEVNYGLLCFSKFIHSLVISVMSLTKRRPLLWRKLGVRSPCMTNTNVIPVAFGFDCISRRGITWGSTYWVVRTLHVVNHRGYGQFCCGFFTIRIRGTHCRLALDRPLHAPFHFTRLTFWSEGNQIWEKHVYNSASLRVLFILNPVNLGPCLHTMSALLLTK